MVEMKITDDAGRRLDWDGKTSGRLKVRGPSVARAYYKEAGHVLDEEGFFDTGDVSTVDRYGYMQVTDRAKDVIKSGGEWISSVELENSIMEHPAVVEACVVAVPDDRWQERPLAAVVIEKDVEVTPADLRDFLSERTARWWLPERWTFVDEVPRTSVGKFDKKVIRALYADGAYDVLLCHD
jgi:fatty-acyl-CoA synthase